MAVHGVKSSHKVLIAGGIIGLVGFLAWIQTRPLKERPPKEWGEEAQPTRLKARARPGEASPADVNLAFSARSLSSNLDY